MVLLKGGRHPLGVTYATPQTLGVGVSTTGGVCTASPLIRTSTSHAICKLLNCKILSSFMATRVFALYL